MAQVLDDLARQNCWICKNKKLNIMINFEDVTGKNREEHNPNWPQIPENRELHPKTEFMSKAIDFYPSHKIWVKVS